MSIKREQNQKLLCCQKNKIEHCIILKTNKISLRVYNRGKIDVSRPQLLSLKFEYQKGYFFSFTYSVKIIHFNSLPPDLNNRYSLFINKKNSQTQTRMAVYFVFRCYLKQRFSTRNYFLGFLMLACFVAIFKGASIRYPLTCIPSQAFAPYTR